MNTTTATAATAPRARVAHLVARTETFTSVVTGQPVEQIVTRCGQVFSGGKAATEVTCRACA